MRLPSHEAMKRGSTSPTLYPARYRDNAVGMPASRGPGPVSAGSPICSQLARRCSNGEHLTTERSADAARLIVPGRSADAPSWHAACRSYPREAAAIPRGGTINGSATQTGGPCAVQRIAALALVAAPPVAWAGGTPTVAMVPGFDADQRRALELWCTGPSRRIAANGAVHFSGNEIASG